MRIYLWLVAVMLILFPHCLYGEEVIFENLAELDLFAAQTIALSDNPGLAAAMTRVVQGSVDGESSEDYGLEESDFATTIGLSLTYNLFRGFGDEAKIAEVASSHREVVYDIQQLRDKVHFEVREAIANLLLAQKQLVLQRETTELVGRTRDLVEVGYSAGQESLVRLNEALRDLVKTQSNLALVLVGLYRLTPVNGKISRTQFSTPLRGYKCLGGNCMLFFSKGFSQFLVFCDSFYGVRH